MCETPEAFNSITRKARKSHKCCECGSEIAKGGQYQYSSGIWNGEPGSYKQCLNCHEIMTRAAIFDRSDFGDGVAFGGLREWFFGFMCIDFKGYEFVEGMSASIGIKPEKLNLCLKINLDAVN